MSITIVEVGPRDGLQNESTILAPTVRAEFIQKLGNTGHRHIEVGAFVSPRWVPQMAKTAEVLHILHNMHNTPPTPRYSVPHYSALTPNIKGLEAAIHSGIKEVAIFTAASESFTKKNINTNIDKSLTRFKELCKVAHEHNIKVRGYISCIAHCPYEGYIQPKQVAVLTEKLLQLGCYQVSLGDTTGRATPAHIRTLLTTLQSNIPFHMLAGHFHDTFGQGLANVFSALEYNITTFDTSVAGLGGCPYSLGASGNLATEDLIYMLNGLGLTTGIQLEPLAHVGHWISQQLGRQNQSKTGIALLRNMDEIT